MPEAASPRVRTGAQTNQSIAAPARTNDPDAALKQYWGYDEFRPLQREAVACALGRQDCLVVLPTGGGKSLCYQVPAACGAGLVLVVSPLIALMDDQVAAARQAGLAAGALHANLTADERARVRAAASAGTLDLLYVSPERLVVGDLLPVIRPRLALVAVDEAHCVSHWGHDFRPEYRQLQPIFDQCSAVPRMALTATATPQVQDDICRQLGLRQPSRFCGHVDRPNLVYRSLPRHGGAKQVLEVIRRHPGEGGIVYAHTRAGVERLAESLKKEGVDAAGYHAGMDPAVRARVQRDFVNESIDVVVATIAFGMGIDRSNVRYVVHANTPKSIEHYQQESGRSGRDGLPAECVLLYSGADLVSHRSLAAKDGPMSPERARALDRQLRDIGRFAVAPVCRHRLLTEHFGQPYPAPGVVAAADGCGACDVCLGETRELPAAEALVTAQKIISAVWRTNASGNARFGAGHVCAVLVGGLDEQIKRHGHDRLSVHGLLKDAGEQPVRAWIDQLIVQGHLAAVEDGVYTFVQMTDAGRALCKGEGQVRLGRVDRPAKEPRGARVRGEQAKAKAGAAASPGSAAEDALFERLRALRRLIAERLAVPPYLVFNDVTLRGMASARPASSDELRLVKGVGEVKLGRYGPAFLAVVAGAQADEALTTFAG